MKRFLYPGLAALVAALAIGCNQTQSTTSSSTTGTTARASETSAPAQPGDTAAAKPAAPEGAAQEITTPSGLKYSDLRVGDGEIAETGLTANVHYTGWLTDGTKFDSSLDRGEPFSFRIGAGQVIRGWDEGVKGMRIGGKRKLVVPPDLGYGSSGAPPVIPPNATLVFEVELLGLVRR